MDFDFLKQNKQEKPKMEVGKKYLLYREFLSPVQLDSFDEQGWELISSLGLGDKIGYYFKKKGGK